jgi:hypothetical protein
MSMNAVFFKERSQVFAAYSAVFPLVVMRILFPETFVCQEVKKSHIFLNNMKL